MTPSITEIIQAAFNAKRYRVKRYTKIKARYRRDEKGRFTGLAQKAYYRIVYDKKAPKVTGVQLVAENIAANNALLDKLVTTHVSKR